MLELQRTAGNHAVVGLLAQRQPTAAPPATTTTAGSAPAGPDQSAPQLSSLDRLREPEIDWINGLSPLLRSTIDSLGEKTSTQVLHLERALAKAKASATGMARVGKERKARTLGDIEDALASLDAKLADDRYKNRQAFMSYMSCSLGGKDGIKAYFESLVQRGNGLIVHPEVARRLDRVEAELRGQGLPMPETTVGQSMRGDHTLNKRERTSPGMLSHAMGVAVDFYAYKNVHVKDQRLMAVLDAVGGRSHSMAVSNAEMATIRTMGEVSMGAATADADHAAKAKAIIDKVGSEFDKLTEASDKVQHSLPVGKEEVLAVHNEVLAAMSALKAAKLAARRAGPKGREAATKALADAQAAYAQTMAALRPRLETMFAPWKRALAAEIEKVNDDARRAGLSMDDITTAPALKAQAQTVRSLKGKPRAAIAAVAAEAQRLTKAASTVAAEVAAAKAWLDGPRAAKLRTKAGPDAVGAWTDTLGQIAARAGGVEAAAAGPHVTASMLLGKPDASLTRARGRNRAFQGDADIKRWLKQLDALEPKATTLTGTAADLQTAVPAEHREAAARYAAMVAGNAKTLAVLRGRAGPGKDGDREALLALAGWQERKKQLFWMQKASDDLIDDPTFMFKQLGVADPGVAQLTQAIGAEKGAGGFFGMTDTGKADPTSHQAGFNKQFFQAMVRYGFEPAARWQTADTMHFEVDRLVNSIVPGTDCDPPTNPEAVAAEATALDRAQAFVGSAVESRAAWDAEQAEKAAGRTQRRADAAR